jgi:hypothetical protein
LVSRGFKPVCGLYFDEEAKKLKQQKTAQQKQETAQKKLETAQKKHKNVHQK